MKRICVKKATQFQSAVPGPKNLCIYSSRLWAMDHGLWFLSYLAGMSPYISLKIKKRHYKHHMIEAHKYLITWISDDISFENSG
jgi:hypothetical protein